MRANLLAAAAIGALFAGQAYAQTDQTGAAAGAMTQQDIEDLGQALEKAGFADFRPVTGGDVFRGMSADGTSAVIAVAPEMGNNTADGGTTGEAAGSGMTDAGMFQVTTEEGRTLYIVVRPEMTGMSGSTTTGEAADTDAASTETAAATGDGDTDNAADNADTATTADNDSDTTAGGAADTTTTADNDADTAAAGDADSTTTADNGTGTTTDAGATGDGGEMTMNVELSGRQQVPPVETSGTGQIAVTFNTETRELNWALDYSELSSDATAAHFHGPADPGETAPPVVPVDEFEDGAKGSATLTEDQAEQLMAGKWYFNLHTENNPNGELRGQVTAAQ